MRRQVVHQSATSRCGFRAVPGGAAPPSSRAASVDPVGEFAVGQLRGVGQHRDALAVAAQVVDEPRSCEHDPAAHHLDAHLGVDRRRVRGCAGAR